MTLFQQQKKALRKSIQHWKENLQADINYIYCNMSSNKCLVCDGIWKDGPRPWLS